MAKNLTIVLLTVKLATGFIALLVGCSTERNSTQSQESIQSAVQQNGKSVNDEPLTKLGPNKVDENSSTTFLPNFSQYASARDKKEAFFGYLSPLADAANAKVLSLRQQLERINPKDITQQQVNHLKILSKTYRIKAIHPDQQLELLLYKVNMIPKSLILAQAANESAWGTSRFALHGNNLFGQWCFRAGCGLVPAKRNSGSNHEVRRFDTPRQSVDAYIANLNTHPSYSKLRQIRQCLINHNEIMTGRALVVGLNHYSSRGLEYIDEIRKLIKTNQLENWAQQWWGDTTNHPCSNLVTIKQSPST
jgi:Bax protein